ncbi:hypothetical protein [Aureimonas sp. SK2]|uniref:hypothetical protein n=1 Tax=Aureimonas sp. SK2 TaxID=3015992 RepID=UPI002443AAC6|nr:hypothetical protein [Aureimonas sp. SK2]
MSVADLSVIGVVAVFLVFIVWVNIRHRKQANKTPRTVETPRRWDQSATRDRAA